MTASQSARLAGLPGDDKHEIAVDEQAVIVMFERDIADIRCHGMNGTPQSV